MLAATRPLFSPLVRGGVSALARSQTSTLAGRASAVSVGSMASVGLFRSLAVSTRVRHAATSAAPQTHKLSQDDNLQLLNEQRSLRPSSPHFTIYQPQITWILSIVNRITGTGLSVLLYVYFSAYAGLPLLGFGDILSTAQVTDFVAQLPFWLKTSLKAPLALAFSFHTWNGFRHLAWDWGIGLSLKAVYRSAYIVLGLTGLSTIGLCMI